MRLTVTPAPGAPSSVARLTGEHLLNIIDALQTSSRCAHLIVQTLLQASCSHT